VVRAEQRSIYLAQPVAAGKGTGVLGNLADSPLPVSRSYSFPTRGRVPCATAGGRKRGLQTCRAISARWGTRYRNRDFTGIRGHEPTAAGDLAGAMQRNLDDSGNYYTLACQPQNKKMEQTVSASSLVKMATPSPIAVATLPILTIRRHSILYSSSTSPSSLNRLSPLCCSWVPRWTWPIVPAEA
jgi:hypothetical protein